MRYLVSSIVILWSFVAHAQQAPPNVYDKWLNASASECASVKDIEAVSTKVVKMTPEQFQFARGIYIAIPPRSHALPSGDRGEIVSAGDVALVMLIDGKQTCARFLAPKDMVDMFEQVAGTAI